VIKLDGQLLLKANKIDVPGMKESYPAFDVDFYDESDDK